MTDRLHSVSANHGLSRNPPHDITEADIQRTDWLTSRPDRSPHAAIDLPVLQRLSQQLGDEPQVMLKTLVQLMLTTCQAGTAGVSWLDTAPSGEGVFRWVAIAGALAELEQTTIPSDFSPCGTTLRRNQPQLFAYPERYFTYLHHVPVPIVETLSIPIYVHGQPLGTLWLMAHDEARQFGLDDQRFMTSLVGFTAAALQAMQSLRQPAEPAAPAPWARNTPTGVYQKELSQQILDSSDDCIKVLDLEGRLLFMSQGGQALLGIQDVTPFLNQPWVNAWEGADQQAALQAVAQARAGKPATFQGYRPTLTGVPKWWDSKISPIREADGQIKRLLCVSRDITARKQSDSQRQQVEETLQESEERYRAIFNQALTGVAYSGPDGKLMLVNQKYCDITGYSAAELYQLHMQELTHPDDLPRNIELYTQMLADGTPFELEKRYIRKDGSIVWVNNYVSVICDRTGTPQSVVAIVLDITARKQAEAISRRVAKLDAFRVTLADALRPLADPIEVQATASRVLGEYLGANRVAYFEVRGSNYVVERDYVNGAQPLAGGYPIDSFGSKLLAAYRRGCVVSAANVEADANLAPEQRAAYAAIQIGAYIGIPLIKGGEFVAGLAVHTAEPRVWTPEELTLAEEVAERTWAAVERARAESALRISEENYRSLFNSIDEGFCLIEVLFDDTETAYDYRFLKANPAFEKHTGLVDVIGKTVRELVPQHDDHWFKTYGNIALTGIPARFENVAKALNRFFDVYAFPLGAPCERQVAVLFTDISDRKYAEAEREQLLANERHYTQQLQGLTTAALAINSALSVEEVLHIITGQAADIIGAHQAVTSMTINQNWAQAINAIYLSDKYAQWKDYAEQPDGSGIYACVCHLNHSLRLTQAELEAHPHWRGFGNEADRHPPLRGWLAAPLVGRDGNNMGLIQLSDKREGEFTPSDESILVQLAQMASVAVENARLYEAEQQARAAAETSREAAHAANRVKDEFLAVLSHELRSPLNPILGWATLLQTKQLDAAKTAHALATIQRNAKLQAELIEDLLDVSRILRGKLSLSVAPVDLGSTITGAMETVRLAAEAKSISITASLASGIGWVSGDATRLQQVIWNLLSNAVKFTPEGGRVDIRLERHDGVRETSAPPSFTASSPASPYAQITITDTGQGIEPDFLPYVFDYFRQADAATTRKFGGLGLGLAIVRHLVELHGGMVAVESLGSGRGATFTVRLPLIPTQATTQPTGQASTLSSDLSGVQVLVVDDELDSREFAAFVLEQAGARVITATTADEALAKLPQCNPQVLLSDIGMPSTDGYMLIQQVRALPPEQGGLIPAIALTAYAGEMNQQQALAAGFEHHMSKPIEPERLIQVIARLIGSA